MQWLVGFQLFMFISLFLYPKLFSLFAVAQLRVPAPLASVIFNSAVKRATAIESMY